ncbi:MAG TPA: Panacea domain-containing protein [Bacillota bacterium]
MSKIARLIPIIEKINRFQKPGPGKKTLQKLVYLIQRKGVGLGFNFSIHYYGPYSSELDYALHSLEMQGVLEIIPDGKTHRISLTENVNLIDEDESEAFDADQLRKIDEIISKFANKSAYDLEALSTTDYVAQQLQTNGNSGDQESIVKGVRKIKGDKFSPEKIEETIAALKEEGYLE